jgi:hypothetical protein
MKPVIAVNMPVKDAAIIHEALTYLISLLKNFSVCLKPPAIKPATLLILKESELGRYSIMPRIERAYPS